MMRFVIASRWFFMNAKLTASVLIWLAFQPLVLMSNDARVLAIDFNCSSSLAAPSQGGFRTLSGEHGATGQYEIATRIEGINVVVSTAGGEGFDFRGSNHGSDRALPGGETGLSALVADHMNTRSGSITILMDGLAPGRYLFRSYHLESYRGAALSFAQGASPTEQQIITASWNGNAVGQVQATALGPSGLNTTSISDAQIPTLEFAFTSDGETSSTIVLSGQFPAANGDVFLLLNGFEVIAAP